MLHLLFAAALHLQSLTPNVPTPPKSGSLVKQATLSTEEEPALPTWYNPEPVPATEKDYLKRLSRAPYLFSPQDQVITSGPVSVRWDEYDLFFHRISLEVGAPYLPGYDNLIGPYEVFPFSRLTVTRVVDTQGKNVYDAKSPFEKGIFPTLKFYDRSTEGNYMFTTRQVHTKKGTPAESLARIEGTVELQLPIEVRPIEFRLSERGKKKSYGGVQVTLHKTEPEQEEGGYDVVTISYRGPKEAYIKILGYDAQGNQIRRYSHTDLDTLPDTRRTSADIETKFFQKPDLIKVFVAKKVTLKKYPFRLAIPPQPASQE